VNLIVDIFDATRSPHIRGAIPGSLKRLHLGLRQRQAGADTVAMDRSG
jgi:hypothetical protein